jgi:hypothetical protein
MSWTAKYPGRCPECRWPITVGDIVARNDDAEVVHLGCQFEAPVRKPAEVCSHCFMEKPCPCEDGQ